MAVLAHIPAAGNPTGEAPPRAVGRAARGAAVTFLFTDIEGSTRLLRDAGPSYAALQQEHRRLIRAAVRSHRGRVVDTQGDSFFVSFLSPRDAVAAAADIQRAQGRHAWPPGLSVRVRVGLHTGEATAVGKGYVGLAVHRAARIAAVAHGGQVLLSQATAALLDDDDLPPGTAVRPIGEHRLKDFPRPATLFQLDVDGLPTDFPAIRDPVRTLRLPVPTGSLLGRDDDVHALARLLRRPDTRLVTVTGPGGIGKTRLALEAARAVADEFSGGVLFVRLDALSDSRLVLSAVADVLGARLEAGGDVLDAVVDALGADRTLLLLDNFEQVVDGAGDIAVLLERAPSTVALVTSRYVLRLRLEHQYHVAPLTEAAAVRLFGERAGAVRPGFVMDARSLAAVTEICRRLDGLPLAIELAAARLGVLSPEAILERLDQQLEVLGPGPVDLPHRQRTLRATMEWSHGLLEPHQRALFARLGVFAGGFPVTGAEFVCTRAGEPSVLDTLAELVDASLLVRLDEGTTDPRLQMLETVRAFAVEKLTESPDRTETENRHTQWLRTLSDTFLQAGEGNLRTVLARFDQERPNLRSALHRLIDAGDIPTAALLLRNAYGYFARRDGERELATWVDRALSLTAGTRTVGRGRLLILQAMLAGVFGNLRAVGPLLEEGRRLLACEDGDGDGDGISDDYDLAFAAVAGIYAAMSHGSLSGATASADEALARFSALGQQLGQAFMQLAVGDLALLRGDSAAAEQRYAQAAQVAGRLGDEAMIGQALSQRAVALLAGGDVQGARRSVLDGAAANRRGGLPTAIAYSLEGLAAVALSEGRTAVAARALAAAAALRAHVATPLAPALPPLVDRLVARAREQLGEEAYSREAAEGARWSAREALARTLDAVEGLPNTPVPSPR